MKKLIFSSLFAACAAFGLSSCMNGDYDATPLTNSGAANPLANTGGSGGSGGSGGGGGGSNVGVAAKGQIRCAVNGTSLTIDGAKWSAIIGRNIGGETPIGIIVKGIGITLNPYNGPATYALGGSTTNTNFASYDVTDFSSGTVVMKDYSSNGTGGTGEVIVTSDANDEMVGTFRFEGFDGSEKMTITNGSFNVPKR